MANEFEIVRGTYESLICYIVNQAGTALDLTGYTSVTLYASKELNATSPTLSKSASSVAASSGQVSFAFAASDTASLATGEYLAEVHIVISSNTIEYRTVQPFIFRILQRVKL